jgi:hypothetical protein
MAAEALDIKTLTTLIMATPKTDIEQSVGRILREKHSNPVVIDIIDSHSIFKNQWSKRKVFYKRENYKILYTTSDIYNNVNINKFDIKMWETIYLPKNKNLLCKTIINSKNKKSISEKSNSSTDKSIINESDESDNEDESKINNSKDKFLCGKCLLPIKK